EDRGCRLEVDIANIRLATDRAISVGVIVTELVTNSLKYAYPGQHGPIRVALQPQDGDHGKGNLVRLVVADDGIGFDPSSPTEANAVHGTGVGRRIVDAMGKSLGGTLLVESAPDGTRTSIVFTDDKPADGQRGQTDAA